MEILVISDIERRLKKIKVFALDMDGTIYLGNKIFPFTLPFLEGLKNAGKKYVFLTNNSSKNSGNYYDKLKKMGIETDRSMIYTSGDATIEYMKGIRPGARVFLMGTRNLEEDFRNAGFSLDEISPDFVVLGFDLTFTYEKLDKACRFIRQGVPFIATHPDFNCPMEENQMAPDCGALSAAITAATGVKPKVIGKPNQEMLEGLLNRTGVSKEELCIMGDRLITDIKMGLDFGILNILVLTGEAKEEDLMGSSILPDFVIEKNVNLLSYL
jgi:HAD superfamily hydrolase (TIGR01457 family)